MLLSETLHPLEIAGGVLIFAGIALERIWHRPALVPPPECGIIRGMADDFMPLLGWDYVELWVGNAKQAAYFYEHALGFTRTAYCGPETGVRDRASYVLEQGDIRFVLSVAAARGARDHARIMRSTATACATSR